MSGRTIYTYVNGNPVSYVDPKGLASVLIGGGGSFVPGVGGEVSGGVYFSNSGTSSAGLFGSIGAGAGVNISADIFFGVMKGSAADIKGETTNVNIGVGLLNITIMFTPDTPLTIDNIVGGTIGIGPGLPAGLSGTKSMTGVIPIKGQLPPSPQSCPAP